MIVSGLGAEEVPGGVVARTATASFDDGSTTPVRVKVPADLAAREADDATGMLPLALLVAMRLGEDLRIDGRVDAEAAARMDELRDHFLVCGAGRLRAVEVRTAGARAAPGAPSPGSAAFLSRGVDSLYQAAHALEAGHGPDALVFADGLEPRHDEVVRAREADLAQEAADVLGRPLILVEAAGLRELADPLFDWEDAVGAGLTWIAHDLAGGLGRVVIPSTDSVRMLAPTGHGPGLDPLLSSARVRLEHADVTRTRMGKVRWLAGRHPDLLPLLKVCFSANTAGNCGRCGKCLHTMACLRAARALERATGFPPDLDLERLAAERHGLISVIVEMAAVRDAARAAGDSDLAEAVQASVRASAARRVSAPPERPSFRALHSEAMLRLLRTGDESDLIGLVRAIDLRGRRHVHGAGWLPPGDVTAELGALLPPGTAARVPLWVLPDGRVATPAVAPGGARPTPSARVRHAVSPRVQGASPRRAARRLLDLATVAPLEAAWPDPSRPPHGFLHDEGGDGRVALWAGDHPVTGDQYTASTADEVAAAGFGSPRLLGHLEAQAPLTGVLGTHATPVIPWA